MRVLPDTSIWVSYLKLGTRGPAAELDKLMAAGTVMTCGPVVAELLTGADDEQRPRLWGLLASLPWAELGPTEWRRVGEVSAALRAAGRKLPLSDIEIAVAAVNGAAQLWSSDHDFQRVQGVFQELGLYSTSTT